MAIRTKYTRYRGYWIELRGPNQPGGYWLIYNNDLVFVGSADYEELDQMIDEIELEG